MVPTDSGWFSNDDDDNDYNGVGVDGGDVNDDYDGGGSNDSGDDDAVDFDVTVHLKITVPTKR